MGGGNRLFAFLCVLPLCALIFFGCSSDSDDGSSGGYSSISDGYTITYKTADGVALGSKKVYANPVTFETAFASKPGYKATKFCDADAKEVLSGAYKCSGDVTITVTLAPISYKIKFEKQSEFSSAVGDVLPATMECEYDKEYSLPSSKLFYTLEYSSYYNSDSPKKSDGWTKTSSTSYPAPARDYESGEKIKNLTTEDGETITLYPYFKKGDFTLKFRTKKTASSYYSDTYTYFSVDSGDTLPSEAIPTYAETGYDTKGWYLSTDGTLKNPIDFSTYSVTGDATFYALTEAVTYTVTFSNEKGSAPASITRKYGDTSLYLSSGEYKLADLTGYVFDGWYDEKGKSYSSISSTQTSDLSLTAKWKPWTATLYFYVGSTYGRSEKVSYGEKITLPKISGKTEGKYLAGWSTVYTSSNIAYDAEGAYTWTGSKNGEQIELYAVLKDLPVNVSVSAVAPSQTDDIKVAYTPASKCFTATFPGVTLFAWFVDGKKLDGEVGATLSVYRLSDTGLHSIMATAESGGRILSGTLLVNIAAED